MTGRALFNEVFLTEARVNDDSAIGGLNNGWRVANTTLMFERTSLGAGGGSAAASLASPGTVAGDLDRRAGDFIASGGRRGGGGGTLFGASSKGLIQLAKGNGAAANPAIRQKLVQLHTIGELARFNGLRAKAAMAAGKDIPGLPNISKLMMSNTVRLSRDLGLEIAGGYGMLHAYDPEDRKALDDATGLPYLSGITEMALFAQGRPSTAAPTRCSATSSASGSSACPRSRASTRTRRSRTCPRTAEPVLGPSDCAPRPRPWPGPPGRARPASRTSTRRRPGPEDRSTPARPRCR
jgi:alkylation response protein AidB-like acyl-CoA dehydrogenase